MGIEPRGPGSRSAFGRTRRTVRTKPHTPRCPRSRAYRTAVRVRRRAIYVRYINPGRFPVFRLSRSVLFSFWLLALGAAARFDASTTESRGIYVTTGPVGTGSCAISSRDSRRSCVSRPRKLTPIVSERAHPRLFTRTVPSLPCVPCTLPPEARITITQALPTAGCYRPTLRHLRVLGCSVARCAPRRSLVLEHDPSCRLILRP